MRLVRVAAAALLAAACGKGPADQGSQSTAPRQFVVAVTTQGDGTVRGLATDCRGSCTQRFDSGARLTLTAAADNDVTFSGWGGACTGAADCTLTITADTSVIAMFVRNPPPPPIPRHQLTVLVDGQGSVRSAPSGIDCGTTCTATFDE